MNKQLQALIEEFDSAAARLRRIADATPDDRWSERAHPGRWSVGECVSHLNLTTRAFLPAIRDALRQGRALPLDERRRYRRGVAGWLLWRMMGPPVRFARIKTTDAFVPGSNEGRPETVAEFERLQSEVVQCTRDANGMPLGALRMTSPFNERLSYNLFAALSILARHQHRHLWQAERVWGNVRR